MRFNVIHISVIRSLVLSCGLFYSISVKSQTNTLNRLLTLDTIIIAKDIFVYSQVNYERDIRNNKIIYYSAKCTGDSIVSGYINLNNNKLKTLNIKDKAGLLDCKYANQVFCGVGDTLYVKNKDNIFIYKSKLLPFETSSSFKNVRDIKIVGDNLKTGWCYNYNEKSSPHKTDIEIQNVKTKQKLEIHPNFKGIEITHNAPNNYIDFTQEMTLFANSFDYKINIYNNNLALTDTLTRQFQTAVPDSFFTAISNYTQPQEIFGKLRSADASYSRIWTAKFNTDTSLFVLYTKPKQFANPDNYRPFQFYIDFWCVENGRWTLKLADLENSYPSNGEYTDIIFSESFSGFEIIQNKLVVIYFGVPLYPSDFTNAAEYDKNVNLYLSKNPLVAKFHIYTINFGSK